MNSFNITTKFTSIRQVIEIYSVSDLMDDEVAQNIMIQIMNVLKGKGYTNDEINYFNVNLDYNKKTEIYYIVPSNFISALWCCDIFPKNCVEINDKQIYLVNNKIYKFDQNNRTLIIKDDK